ncbi:MAG: EutN/CcmL family microcompartment protein [Pirellulaceae bacterium]
MRIAEIVGTVTLNRCHGSFVGARLRLAVPLSLANLSGREQPSADEMVLWDGVGSGIGSRVAMSEGAEAAQPFRPEIKPVDAYAAALLDEINIHINE